MMSDYTTVDSNKSLLPIYYVEEKGDDRQFRGRVTLQEKRWS